jgi:3-oxoacyl-[acyl-carrier protein] reductase
MARKTALVTGASGGIGAACAQMLARQGYTVIAHANRGTEAVTALAARLNAEGCDVHPVQCDLADSAAVNALCKELLRVYHRIDALVLNAGVSYTGLLCDMTDEQWHSVMDVNLSSMFYLCRTLTPAMVSARQGSIVTISSMWGQVGASCEVDYSASKAALIGFTKALAQEVAPSGIRVNCIAPGVIRTKMLDCYGEDTLQALADETPLGRLGTPEDIAAAAAFLCGGGAEFITGQVLGVNGGFVI